MQEDSSEDTIILAVREFANSITSGRKIIADMSALIDVTSQLPLASFDYWERLIRSEFSLALRNTNPPKWKFWSKPYDFLTWLDLISRDGYKREKTLRTLSDAAPNTFFFSLALRRLNDWVPQVRAAARDKLPEIAKATDPQHVAEALCVALSNWNSWGRIGEADKNVVLHIASEESIAEALRSKIISSTSGPMPSLFSQLGRTAILDDYLEEIAGHAVQPSVRAKAYRSLLEGRIAWVEKRKWEWTDIRYCEGRLNAVISERKLNVQTPLLDLLKYSSDDRSSIVRRISAEFLIRELDVLGDSSWDFAQRFASDKSNAVSERGLFALKKLEEAGYSNSSS